MDENRSPGDRLLDLVVFGPAGLALTAAEEFPKLVDKGRHHLEGQVRTARLVGQVAVQMGRRQFDQFVAQRSSKPTPPPSPAPSEPAVSHRPSPVVAVAETARVVTTAATPVIGVPGPNEAAPSNGAAATNGTTTSKTAKAKAAPASGAVSDGSVGSSSLAIPGYDSLSASQVVQRLAGLSHSELIDVRAHEQAQRHRRTILNRVEQLLAGVDAE
jgi:hypothetical protein